MRKPVMVVLLVVSIPMALACSDRSPTAPMAAGAASPEVAAAPGAVSRSRSTTVLPPRSDESLPPGVWGSTEASLTVGPSGAKLLILSASLPMGGCYGKFGDIGQAIHRGRFDLSGIHTQLLGVYPGRIQYPAEFSGLVLGDTLTITVTVPELSESFGPYVLVRGVTNSWTPCLYP